MAASTATTVAQYLAELPPDRRAVVARVRDVVREHMPAGYEESMAWGLICWSVPLSRFRDTHNGQPLGYAFLGAQKHYYVLHLTALYMDPERDAEFRRAYGATGRRLDMGKGCVRFRTLEALPLDVVAQAIARTTPEEYVAIYERGRAGTRKTAARKAAAQKAGAKQAVAKKAAVKKASARKPAAKSATAAKRK